MAKMASPQAQRLTHSGPKRDHKSMDVKACGMCEIPPRTGAAGQGEVEDEGRGQDGQHLLAQQARLELEQGVEGALHLPRVGPPPPVARHVVRVRHHLARGRVDEGSHK
jgi:hypothetical protein